MLLEGNASIITGVADADGVAEGEIVVRFIHTISGEAVGNGTATGELSEVRDRYHATQDERAIDGQPRPNFPLLVYHTDVRNLSDLAVVPDNGYFLLSVLYDKDLDDPLFAAHGGFPKYIGQKVTRTIQGVTFTQYRFRAPAKREVVCYKGSLILYRYDNDVWVRYTSYPQRLLSSCLAFEIFDTQKIYDYLAQVIGAAQYQWGYDARRILEFKVPGDCPTARLPYLAEHLGQTVRADETESQQRGKILLGLECSRNAGTARGVELRMQALGYIGTAQEVWVWPDHAETYTRPPNSSVASPLVFGDPDKPTAVSAVGTVLSNTTRFRVTSNAPDSWDVGDLLEVTPTGGTPAVFSISAIATVGLDRLVTVPMEASAAFLAPGASLRIVRRSWLSIPHGFLSGAPQDYWPSSRCIVSYADKSGDPIAEPPPGFAGMSTFHSFLAEQLYSDVLPMASDIRAFAPIVGYSEPGDGSAVSDSLLITNLP